MSESLKENAGKGIKKQYFTVQEMSALTGLPASWFYRQIRLGQIEHYKAGRYVLLKPDVMERCRRPEVES